MVGKVELRCADILCSVLGLVILAPLGMLAAGAAVVAFGSIFYTDRRIGLNKQPFLHIKFRTMRPGAAIGRSYLETRRIPPLFRILRAVHADEYPELIFVLWGRMSMVGPRPLPARIIDGCLSPPSPDRMALPPGLTGLSQIKLARMGLISSSCQFALDAAWIRRSNLGLYLRIIGATLLLPLTRNKQKKTATDNSYRLSLVAAFQGSPKDSR